MRQLILVQSQLIGDSKCGPQDSCEVGVTSGDDGDVVAEDRPAEGLDMSSNGVQELGTRPGHAPSEDNDLWIHDSGDVDAEHRQVPCRL